MINKPQIINALRKTIDSYGIEVINDKAQLKASLSDILPGTSYKFERKFLIDALELDEWETLLEAHFRDQYEHIRVVKVLKSLLVTNLGWSEDHSINVLDCYTKAMGWYDVILPQTENELLSNIKYKKPVFSETNNISCDDNSKLSYLLEQSKEIKVNQKDKEYYKIITKSNDKSRYNKRNPSSPNVGDLIKFGSYKWRVLSTENNNALLISLNITHVNKEYNNCRSANWESCTIRKWLNNDFLQNFSIQEQSRILLTTNSNENNLWFGTQGSNTTSDRIFILSLTEVIDYFDDSEQLKSFNPNTTKYIDDEYNASRIATYKKTPAWWWLRSPGDRNSNAAYVGNSGIIHIGGINVTNGNPHGGVRPVLWLSM
jgi:hypothetical protein